MLLAMTVAAVPAFGSELEELKAEMRRLQQRIEQLEERQKREAAQQPQPAAPTAAASPAAPAGGESVKAGTLPGSILIPGTATSLRPYVSVRIDATYDTAGRNNDTRNNDWATAVFAQPLRINSANRQRDDQFYGTARASRLGLDSSTPTPLGTLETKVEADFNAPNDYMGELASNGVMFRLRHAYGKLGNLLVGQTWSNYIDLRSYPETVDFNPPGNTTLLRQTQLRYTIPVGPTTLSLAVENPESLTSTPPVQTLSNSGRNDFDRIPDVTANWSWHGERAHLSLHAATMEYHNDFRTKRGYALGLSGSAALGTGTLVAGVQGGEGVGRYMFNSIMQGAADTGRDLLLWRAAGFHLGYTQPWTATLRSNVILSRTVFGANASADAYQRSAWAGKVDEFVPNRRVDQAFVNLFWSVTKNIETGIEYAWGERETFAGERGRQQRINAMIQYSLP
ncbi:DcaP family trimeric outer membrane transporter [Trichlorobacter ammonificans]|uniref:Porin subfamily protein n=1 Tax=Trichlorobacter ammonificans TaxID=2916410 RepID=A0ABM9D467_9BACT|nr:DcaP family trimeric outer membrane transporter [Trichlorobacter ammonificans]CAH2030040.1 Porin subfamily protein [Trichlorobacter ammonificans]